MKNQRLKELLQEILELSYSSEQMDLSELQNQMEEIHELSAKLLIEIGIKPIVQVFGWKPTEQQEIVASHSKKKEGAT